MSDTGTIVIVGASLTGISRAHTAGRSGTDVLGCPAEGPFNAGVDLHPDTGRECTGCVLSIQAGRISAAWSSTAP